MDYKHGCGGMVLLLEADMLRDKMEAGMLSQGLALDAEMVGDGKKTGMMGEGMALEAEF